MNFFSHCPIPPGGQTNPHHMKYYLGQNPTKETLIFFNKKIRKHIYILLTQKECKYNFMFHTIIVITNFSVTLSQLDLLKFDITLSYRPILTNILYKIYGRLLSYTMHYMVRFCPGGVCQKGLCPKGFCPGGVLSAIPPPTHIGPTVMVSNSGLMHVKMFVYSTFKRQTLRIWSYLNNLALCGRQRRHFKFWSISSISC